MLEREINKKSTGTEGSTWHQSAVHECWPGGPIVSTPQECHGIERPWAASLPSLSLDGLDQVASGKQKTESMRMANAPEAETQQPQVIRIMPDGTVVIGPKNDPPVWDRK
ncbi:MAG TPA: hypothetical protein V6C89_11320 [Drouetiella sp.]